MKIVKYSQFRKNMKSYLDEVSNDFKTLIVTRKNNNVVIMSEEAYNNLLENSYLTKEKANYDWLIESKNQLNNHKETYTS